MGTYYGGTGDDTIKGSTGADTMYGGKGNDYYYINNANDVIVEKPGEGTDTLRLENLRSFTLPANVENGIIGAYASSMYGNELGNNISVAKDATTSTVSIYGYGGNDTITGCPGDDYLDGGDGNDYIYGGDGNDRISGAKGNDTLYGGAGNDTFFTNEGGNDFLYGQAGNDVYTIRHMDGLATIEDASGSDKILFEGMTAQSNHIAFFKDSNGNLYIDSYIEAGKQVTCIKNFDSSSVNSIEGATQYITDTAINYVIQQMSAYASENNITLNSVADVKANDELMAMIANTWFDKAA